jgi:hypothetical protein
MGPARRTFSARSSQPPSELRDLRGIDTVGGNEIELVERLGLGKPRIAQPLTHGGLATRCDLDGEDLVQVVLVRPFLFASLTRERLELASSAGHLELARLLAHEVADHPGATHCTPPSHVT